MLYSNEGLLTNPRTIKSLEKSKYLIEVYTDVVIEGSLTSSASKDCNKITELEKKLVASKNAVIDNKVISDMFTLYSKIFTSKNMILELDEFIKDFVQFNLMKYKNVKIDISKEHTNRIDKINAVAAAIKSKTKAPANSRKLNMGGVLVPEENSDENIQYKGGLGSIIGVTGNTIGLDIEVNELDNIVGNTVVYDDVEDEPKVVENTKVDEPKVDVKSKSDKTSKVVEPKIVDEPKVDEKSKSDKTAKVVEPKIVEKAKVVDEPKIVENTKVDEPKVDEKAKVDDEPKIAETSKVVEPKIVENANDDEKANVDDEPKSDKKAKVVEPKIDVKANDEVSDYDEIITMYANMGIIVDKSVVKNLIEGTISEDIIKSITNSTDILNIAALNKVRSVYGKTYVSKVSDSTLKLSAFISAGILIGANEIRISKGEEVFIKFAKIAQDRDMYRILSHLDSWNDVSDRKIVARIVSITVKSGLLKMAGLEYRECFGGNIEVFDKCMDTLSESLVESCIKFNDGQIKMLNALVLSCNYMSLFNFIEKNVKVCDNKVEEVMLQAYNM